MYGFYGSLRKEGYNFRRVFGENLPEQVGEFKAAGYTMVDLNYYPKVYATPESTSEVLFEVFDVKDKNAQNFIDMMERGAGYTPASLDSPYGPITIYVGRAASLAGAVIDLRNVVTSGDWIDYCKQNKRDY